MACHLNHVAARVAPQKVSVRVGGAVAPMVDALRAALLGAAVDGGAHPHDVVRLEVGPVALLQLLSHRLELLQEQDSSQLALYLRDMQVALLPTGLAPRRRRQQQLASLKRRTKDMSDACGRLLLRVSSFLPMLAAACISIPNMMHPACLPVSVALAAGWNVFQPLHRCMDRPCSRLQLSGRRWFTCSSGSPQGLQPH